MKDICLITYLREDEVFTDEIVKLCIELHKKAPSFKCIIFSNGNYKLEESYSFNIDIIYMPGTKYKRIKHLIENDDSKYFISVDNDIRSNISNVLTFVDITISGNYDIGWGKIMSEKQVGFISKLIVIDKILSHYYIRPLLWKFKIGITLPGQFFIIKGKTFANKLLEVDTFLDDLALGLYVRENNKKINVHMSKMILGYECPNNTFKGLFKQRTRWADGFLSILNGLQNKVEKRYVIIHGVSYHLLWIIHLFILLLLSKINLIFGISYILLSSCILSRLNIKLLFHAFLYQIVFPIFHIKWILKVIGLKK